MKTTSDRVGLKIAYSKANSTLPEKLPYIENKEAEKAYKLLVRKFGKKEMMFFGTWKKVKMRPRTYNRPRKVWVCLSGDPSTLHNGWRRLIHDVAHDIFSWRSPGLPDHCKFQADLEAEICEYVLKSGWLNGSLKPKPLPKLSNDEKKVIKIKRFEANILRWETKIKRANTYLKKYKTKLKRLSK
tara:strand:+ start:1550 stop:2104 length:555 start_codon:yes stop_codon:yes gene_type:complete